MANIRVTPGSKGKLSLIVAGNRSYSMAYGATTDIPDFDAHLFEANGFIALGTVGPTASRPVGVSAGTEYIDATLNAVIKSDGNGAWHNMVTGAAV